MTNNVIQISFTVEGSSNSNLPIYIVVFAVILVGGAVLYSYSKRDNKAVTKTKAAPVIQESSVNFPLILNCSQCSSRVRVARPGSFRCPSCKAVSLVDSNGKIDSKGQEKENIEKAITSKSTIAMPSTNTRKPVSSTNRRRRMEEFLSGDSEEESEEESEESEEELSAAEKLKLLKEEDSVLAPSEEVQELQTEGPEPELEEPESEEVQEKPKKKRRNPPKGGSFGPTVGGF